VTDGDLMHYREFCRRFGGGFLRQHGHGTGSPCWISCQYCCPISAALSKGWLKVRPTPRALKPADWHGH
jgi:hypothetical protein